MTIKNVHVRTADARTQLWDEIHNQVSESTMGNAFVSQEEQETLPEFIQKAADQVRQEKGPYARVEISELVDKATDNAMQTWEKFNPQNSGRDSIFLSREEIGQISAEDSDLGELTQKAYNHISLRASQGQHHGYEMAGRVKTRCEPFGFLGMRDSVGFMSNPENRAKIPSKVAASWDFYHEKLDGVDGARISIDSQYVTNQDEIENFRMVFVYTDEGYGFLETFSDLGEPLASGKLTQKDERTWDVDWDQTFGDVRNSL